MKVFFSILFLICVLTVSGYRFYALIFHEYCLIHVHDISFLEVETNISIVLTQTYCLLLMNITKEIFMQLAKL
jgi:hypothetical protein